jgi:hypothetical protein
MRKLADGLTMAEISWIDLYIGVGEGLHVGDAKARSGHGRDLRESI